MESFFIQVETTPYISKVCFNSFTFNIIMKHNFYNNVLYKPMFLSEQIKRYSAYFCFVFVFCDQNSSGEILTKII